MAAVLMVLLIAAAYERVRLAGFIWDDDMHLTQNPCVVGPLGFAEIWTTPHARIGPLTITGFWLEHRLWGLNPLFFHLVNVALHAVNALLLWRVLGALRVPGAWLGAALWALHPVQAETVAWVTELKNTLSGCFYLTCVLCWAHWLRTRQRWCYAGMLAAALLAMAAKSSTVVLPGVLALCAWWLERRWSWKNVLQLAPVAIFSIASAALAIYTQSLEGGLDLMTHRSLAERIATAGEVIAFDLWKLLWPHPLMFVYPRWLGGQEAWFAFAAIIIALTFLLWRQRSDKARALLMTLACFITALLPVMGLVDHYFIRYSFFGDHFQYLASMAPAALVGAWLMRLPRMPAAGVAALLIALLGGLTWRHSQIFESQDALWQDTVAKNPDAWMAWNNLGELHLHRGALQLAREHLERSLALHADNHEAHNNLAALHLKDGRAGLAMQHARRAVELDAAGLEARHTLAAALFRNGDLDEAAQECEALLRLDSGAQRTLTLLAAIWQKAGRAAECEKALRRLLALDDHQGDAHFNLAQLLRHHRRVKEAVRHYEKAAEHQPQPVLALTNLAWVLATCPDASIRDPKRALELATRADQLAQGHDLLAKRSLAVALAATGDFEAALKAATSALEAARASSNAELVAAFSGDIEMIRQKIQLLDPDLEPVKQ
jgi:tetratricopeptide (TPR) repeat protein